MRVIAEGATLVDSVRAVRVLETSHPPVYFVPPSDIVTDRLMLSERLSFCEWKGRAEYFDLRLIEGRALPSVAFSYPEPSARFEGYAGWLSFYAGSLVIDNGDGCFVGEERVAPQPGGFYSGWITRAYAGPFKGVPGSAGW
ncbi:MAG: DUF427 domain-containing protein [Planctomycetota bacterium]